MTQESMDTGGLYVHVPVNYLPEREYVIRTLLEDFLGLGITIRHESRADTLIQSSRKDSPSLVIRDGLFRLPSREWLTPRTVPDSLQATCVAPTLLSQGLRHSRVPIIFGAELSNGAYIELSPQLVTIGIDLLGSAFFLLSRYEEVARPVADAHGRFPARASLMGRAGLLHRPLVNEYTEILWGALSYLFPYLRRSARRYRVLPTHDVDRPFCTYRHSLREVARHVAADAFRRRSPALGLRRVRNVLDVRRDGPRKDICNTFEWIMQQSESRGLRSAFYFLSKSTSPIDSDYAFTDTPIRELIRSVHARGHEIGIHPTYESMESPDKIAREFDQLRQVAADEDVRQVAWGGRQHFLRWKAGRTWRDWSAAGVDYDSSVGFADAAGFRCGTCYEFRTFDLTSRQRLRLRERPLVVMEASLLSKQYGGYSYSAATGVIASLAQECQHHAGDFVLLWHNNHLLTRRERNLYCEVLDTVLGEAGAAATGA